RAAHLDLSAAPAILPQLDALTALLDGDVRVAGTRRRPQVTGALRVQDGALQLDGSPFAYRNLAVEASSTDGREVVLRLAARSQGGSVADRFSLLSRSA